MKITLAENFTDEECSLANSLKSDLMEGCHELEEFSKVEIYGLKEDNGLFSILFDISYGDSQHAGKTLYHLY